MTGSRPPRTAGARIAGSRLGRLGAALAASGSRARRRYPGVDHLWRAKRRYDEVHGPRLAAALAYYAFFAALALSLLAFSILGYLLSADSALVNDVSRYLSRNLPFLRTDDIRNAWQAVGVLSLAGFVLTGVGWVDGTRSSQRAVWGLDQQPGGVVRRRLVDLGMLAGLGLLLGLSLMVSSGLVWLARGLLRAGPGPAGLLDPAVGALGQALSVLVNLILAAALLAAVPRLRIPPRRLLAPALLVGLGLTLLSTVGRTLIGHATHNPAYRVVGGAVGLLIFLDLFGQLLLFGAALAATSPHGAVVDLAAGPPPPTGVGPAS